MNKTGIPYLDFCWNPCGYGCSNSSHCPTCWARRQATAGGPRSPACPQCAAFKVHFHAERLKRDKSPEGRRKSAVIGVEFLGDLFDRARPIEQVLAVLELMVRVPQHTYVLLTQQPARAATMLERFYVAQPPSAVAVESQPGAAVPHLPANWFIGATIKGAGEPDNSDKLGALLSINGRRWISIEPIQGDMSGLLATLLAGAVELIVIGADNQPDAPWDLALVTNTVYAVSPIKPACHGPKIYIKQLWQLFCDRCGKVFGDADRIDDQVCPCGESYRRRLVTEPAEFPEPLRLRQLPWTLTTK